MAIPFNRIHFVDLVERDDAARNKLAVEKSGLERAKKDRGELLDFEQRRLDTLIDLVDPKTTPIVDPLFIAVRDLFVDGLKKSVPDHDVGHFKDDKEDVWREIILPAMTVYGQLAADNVIPPRIAIIGGDAHMDRTDPTTDKFSGALFEAYGKIVRETKLIFAIFNILATLGMPLSRDQDIKLRAMELGKVSRSLIGRGLDENAEQLPREVNAALDAIQRRGSDLPPSQIEINLPELDQIAEDEIVTSNIWALQPIHFSAMLEQLKFFQVVDKLAELFSKGVLPIGRGNGGYSAGNFLYKYWRDAANRISEAERRGFYARCFGIPGGDDGGAPNTYFNSLQIGFASTVSSYVRQSNLDDLLRARVPGAVSQQQVRKAARDLASNLSLHGYGMTWFVATELQKQVTDMLELLSSPEIMGAYGARDPWQVVDQVATLELGGAKNSVKYRTLATASAVIMAWLATNTSKISGSSYDQLIDVSQIFNPQPRRPGTKATVEPTDYDLVNACEQLIAVMAVDETKVEELSQPRESPMMTTKPIAVPQVVRDALGGTDLAALGLGRARAI